MSHHSTSHFGFRAWFASLGSWGPARHAIRTFDRPDRFELRREIRQIVAQLVDRNLSCRGTLRYGVPALARTARSVTEFREALRACTSLFSQLEAASGFSWIKLTDAEFSALVDEAVHCQRRGQPYSVHVQPERGHHGEEVHYHRHVGWWTESSAYVMDSPQAITLRQEPMRG